MSVGLYVSYTGAAAGLQQLETIANNIANASTVGYLRDRTRFDSVLGANMPFVQTRSALLDLGAGTAKLTRNPLNAAIDGPGFFVVEAADGEELYTRRGDFRLDGEGRLVLPNGLPVQGDGGELSVPAGVDVTLQSDGSLVGPNGVIGRLRVVRFADAIGLEKLGRGLIRAGDFAEPEAVERPNLSVGFVETANVNLASEMVALIQTARSFEASMQSLRINDQLTQRLIQSQSG